jgi:cytoskeletal protein RodZ
MPPTRDWAASQGAWAGRAEVRPPRPGDYVTTTTEWDAVPPPQEPRSKWWMPILIGILALLLLGLLGWGIYLIAQNTDDGAETPAPAASASLPVTEPTPTEPTTEPTTTEPTSPPTTEPTATEVTVPALEGLSQQEAQQALDRSGLTYRLIFRASDAAPGTVIDSDPSEGQEVPPDTQVTLVIAAERTTVPTTPPTGQGDED